MALEADARPRKSNRGILVGVKIVECGEGVSAAFATKMMADLGADVIKVESLDGDSARKRGPYPNDKPDHEKSGQFLYLNSNKRGITLNLLNPKGRRLLGSLLAQADILIHNVAPRERRLLELESKTLSQEFPNLMIVGISPFGDQGPYRDWKAYALNVENAGGMAFLAPGASQHPELPPLKAFGQQAEYQGGIHACYAALTAYFGRLNGDDALVIEISEQECLVAMLEMNLMHYTYTGRETSRLGKRVIGPWLLSECSDGVIFVACAEEAQWQRMVELMGNPEWANEELFKDRIARGENADALNLFVKEWIAPWKKRELFHAGQGQRVPFASVNSMRDVYDDAQLKFRDYFVEVDYPEIGKLRLPGMPSRYGIDTWAIRTTAPRLGQHNEEVFIDELGLSCEELETLKKQLVI
jgi:crotonobetainyl-CoA:carnitine CoA-transferase CaiB-like acyl-CoA transferase